MIDTHDGAGCYPTLPLILITVLTRQACYQSLGINVSEQGVTPLCLWISSLS